MCKVEFLRKSLTFSIFIAAVDCKKRFVDLTVGWPGSVADGRVFRNSTLNANLERFMGPLPSTHVKTKATVDNHTTQIVSVPPFILAVAAYPSTARIVPTYKSSKRASVVV